MANKLEVSVGINNAPFKAGLDEMKRGAAKFKGELSSMFIGAVGPAALAAGAVLTFRKAISKASEMEGFQTAFKTILGSMQAAKDRMKELSDFAASTPFELPEIAQASKTLQTLTNGALATGDGLRIVGDAAATAQRPFSELAVTIGRVYAGAMAGSKTIGAEINRLVELGLVSIETKNRLTDMMDAGKKGSEVWAVVAKDLERFKGQMEAMSDTLEGRMSTLGDAWDEVLRRFAQPLLPNTKEATSDLTSLAGFVADLGSVLGLSFKGLYAYIAGFVDLTINGIGAIGDMAAGLWKGTAVNNKSAGEDIAQGWENAKSRVGKSLDRSKRRFDVDHESGSKKGTGTTPDAEALAQENAINAEREKEEKRREERLKKIAEAEADAAREALEGQQKINALIEERNRLLEVFKSNSESDEGIDALEKSQRIKRQIETEEKRQSEEKKRREDDIAKQKEDDAKDEADRLQRIDDALKSQFEAEEADRISQLKGEDKLKALQAKKDRMQAEADLLEESDPEAAARKRTEIISVNAEIRSEREALKDGGKDTLKEQEDKVKDAQGKVNDARRAAASVPVDSLGAVGGGRGNFGSGETAVRVAQQQLQVQQRMLAALEAQASKPDKRDANPWR
jgi:hypothetical protein